MNASLTRSERAKCDVSLKARYVYQQVQGAQEASPAVLLFDRTQTW
jgi:hypothetical protein